MSLSLIPCCMSLRPEIPYIPIYQFLRSYIKGACDLLHCSIQVVRVYTMLLLGRNLGVFLDTENKCQDQIKEKFRKKGTCKGGGGGRGSKERVMRVVGEQVGQGGCCGPVALWPCGPLKGGGGGYSTENWVSTMKLTERLIAVNIQSSMHTEVAVIFPLSFDLKR